MKLQDCELNATAVAMAPIRRTAPEESWTKARDEGALPRSLFDLYRRANYLSFGTAPQFLKDSDSILFSYFGMMLRSLASSLIEAERECKEYVESIKGGPQEREFYVR